MNIIKKFFHDITLKKRINTINTVLKSFKDSYENYNKLELIKSLYKHYLTDVDNDLVKIIDNIKEINVEETKKEPLVVTFENVVME